MRNGNIMNVGIIGVGSISEVHFNGYAQNDHVALIAVCDRDEQRARQKADKYGAKKCSQNTGNCLRIPRSMRSASARGTTCTLKFALLPLKPASTSL